jgi:hypothetical protein
MLTRLLVLSLTVFCLSCQSNKNSTQSNWEEVRGSGDMKIKNAALEALQAKITEQQKNGSLKKTNLFAHIKNEYEANQYLIKNYIDLMLYYENKHKNFWITNIEQMDTSRASKDRMIDTVQRTNRIEQLLTDAIWNTAQSHNPK